MTLPPPTGQTIVAPLTTTTTTTTTTIPPTRTPRSGMTSTAIWTVDPSTLERNGEPIVLPGFTGEPAALPDGGMVITSNSSRLFTVVDPQAGTTATFDYPGRWLNVDILAVDDSGRVFVVHGATEGLLASFHPDTGEFAELGGMDWPYGAQLLADDRRLATYHPRLHTGNPGKELPRVAVLELDTGEIAVELELTGVEHGYIPIDPDLASDPLFPFASVEPGIAWDLNRELIYAVHADGGGITVGDLATGEVTTKRFNDPSLWTNLFAWLIPPAEAKGAGNEAGRQAWLSGDGSRLISTGVQTDYRRDPTTRELTIVTDPLETLIIDTERLEVVRRFDVMADRGSVSPDGTRWVITGADSRQVVCDELCHGVQGQDPEFVVDDTVFAGLYIIDTGDAEILHYIEDGTNHYLQTFHGDSLITESFGPDGDFYESIDIRTGEVTGRVPFGEQWYVANEAGVFEFELVDEP